MGTKAALRAATYDGDFNEWTQTQARALRRRRAAELDWENLAEEIESLGRSDQREVKSRVTTLLVHLLKMAVSVGETQRQLGRYDRPRKAGDPVHT